MTIIGKSLIGLGTVGTIGGIGAYAGGLFESKKYKSNPTITKTTYKDKLEAEGFEVLKTNADSTDWKAVLDDYKNATTRSFKGTKEADKTQEQLRNDCKAIIDQEVKENKNYSLLTQWCVKKKKMSEVLKRGKRKTLDFKTPEVPSEKGHWKNKIQALRKIKVKPNPIKVEITDSDEELITNIAALKKGCEGLQIKTMTTTDDKFEENFKLAKDWCTII